MYSRQILILIVSICVANGESNDQYRLVNTTNGQVQGVRNTTLLNGIPFYSFKGIPYAKPPINDLRFKAPEPIESWSPTVFDAFEYGNICPQFVIICNPSPSSEECLTLNIFVPADVLPDEKMAVLFFIHGGSYRVGSGDDFFFGPDFIVEKQTILVTINYRLGPFGFLSLNSSEYSGNMGLKDQQLALKWVHDNIEHFGGDSQRITIFGQSAGGASVHFHILSEESRKYFRNAIPMSGSIENYWALARDPNHLEYAYKIASDFNVTASNFDELVTFWKNVAVSDDLHWYTILDKSDDVFQIIFAPVVENKDATQPFLIETPEKLYESSKIDVNVMFTSTSAEMLALLPPKGDGFYDELNVNFENYARLPFRGLNLSHDTKAYRDLTDEIRQFYFGNETINESSTLKYYEFLSDANFFWGVDQSVKHLAANSKGKTFYTWFSVDSHLNIWKNTDFLFGHMSNETGAGHGDDLCYLFRCSVARSRYEEILQNKTDAKSKLSLQTIELMTTIYTNFAKYGEPSHKNDPIAGVFPVQQDRVHFLSIGNDGLATGTNPRQKNFEFWKIIKQRAFDYSNDERQNEIDSK